MQPAAPLIVFCQPGDRRSAGIQQARSRLGMPPALLIPYAGLLENQPLADLLEQAVQQQAAGLPEQLSRQLRGTMPEPPGLSSPALNGWPGAVPPATPDSSGYSVLDSAAGPRSS